MDEKFVVGIILGVRLVVELKDVEVNKITHLVVYCLVTSIFVVLVFEVRGLRTMAENMVRDHQSYCLCKFDEPFLSYSVVHCLVILPVHIPAVQVIVKDELTEFLTAEIGILTCGGGEFTVSECAHQDFDAIFVVYIFKSYLYLLSGISEGVPLGKICHRVGPNHGHVFRAACAAPEGQNNDVIVMRGCVSWHSQTSGDAVTIP